MEAAGDGHKSAASTVKKNRKSSKLRPARVASSDVPKSPGNGRYGKHGQKERLSSLWEFFYDSGDGVRGDGVMGEGVRDEGDRCEGVPDQGVNGNGCIGEKGRLKNIRGFLFKRRKSPLKGWHKRYFVLQGGVLRCARNPVQMRKGKLLSCTDMAMAVITCDSNRWKIDIDEERQVHHLKTKNASHFAAWSTCLLAHEMFRKAQLTGTEGIGGEREGEKEAEVGRGMEEWMSRTQEVISTLKSELEVVRDSLEVIGMYVKTLPKSSDPQHTSTETVVDGTGHSLPITSDVPSGGRERGGGRERRRWGRRKHEKRSRDTNYFLSSNLDPAPSISLSHSSSHLEEMMEENIIRDDFSSTAITVYSQFTDILEKLEWIQKSFHESCSIEKAQKQQTHIILNNQKLMLRQSLVQNADLKNRLMQIQALTSGILTAPIATAGFQTPLRRTPSARSQKINNSGSSLSRYRGAQPLVRFDSLVSVHSSLSEKFFDALDDVQELSTEEEEEEEEGEEEAEEEGEEGEGIEENEETETEGEESGGELYSSFSAEVLSVSLSPSSRSAMWRSPEDGSVSGERSGGEGGMQRRSVLPSAMADVGDFSLWSILRKNIGKDLSRISMPVSLNEPLSALQRLCEEAQYSELLDEAASLENPSDRMVRVAAFAVSAYVSAYHRPTRKPFNPLLGETYEWIREDKGFRFVAEQVSHHPPIAACHCESPNFSFWQDARIKSKFWGKSMEVFPVGVINVTLPKYEDHYQWEKVTSCIHNVLGGQRWVDQYGEMTITNRGKCSCKLTFVKASYWSSKKYEVHGYVYNGDGERVRHLFGTWHEAIYCGEEGNATCVWRAAPMPANSEQCYGFNQFAVQLNGFEKDMREKLPPTDSRFRPDQRLLEEGFIEQAEQEKHRVEQIQREARAERERLRQEWTPNFFRKESGGGQECWMSQGNYWKHRESNLKTVSLPKLW